MLAGKAYINIVPSMRGFRSAVEKEIKGLDNLKFTGLSSGLTKSVNNATKGFNLNGLTNKASSAFSRVGTHAKSALSSAFGSVNFSGLTSKASSAFSQVGAGFRNSLSSAFSSINFSGLGNSLKNAIVGALAGVGAFVTSQIGGAIESYDIIARFPKVLANFGVSGAEASDAIAKLREGIQGLPTKTSDLTSNFTRLFSVFGESKGIDYVTDLTLALNNFGLSAGAPIESVRSSTEQLLQGLSRGKIEGEEWNSILSTLAGSATQVAKDLLGGDASIQDLRDAMADGRLTTEDFVNSLIKLNKNGVGGLASFAQQAKTASEGISTSWENVKTATQNALMELIPSQTASAIDSFASKIKELKKVLSSLKDSGNLTEALGAFGAVSIAAFAPLLSSLPIVGGLFAGLSAPVSAVIGLIVGIITQSEALRDALYNTFSSLDFSSFITALKTAFSGIFAILGQIGDAFAPVISALQPVFQFLINSGNFAINSITSALSFLWGILQPIVNFVSSVAVSLLTFISPLIEFVSGKISEFGNMWSLLGAIVGAVVGAIVGLVTWLWQGVVNIVTMLVTSVVNFFTNLYGTLVSIVSSIVSSVVGFFSNLWGTLTGLVSSGISTVVNLFSSLGSQISSAVGSLYHVGADIVNGIISGISNTIGKVKDMLVGGIESAVSAVTGFLNINSPSKLFRDEVGKPISEGIAVGIDANANMITDSAVKAVDIASDVYNSVGDAKGVGGWGDIGNAEGGRAQVIQNISLYETNPASVAKVIENRWSSALGVL